MYKYLFKPLFDFILSLIAMPFLILLCIPVAIAIKIDDGGPVFYCGKRIGRKGKPFKMVKFRTMKVNAPDLRLSDGSTYNSDEDERVTRVGRFLRKTSIDELPQFFNIFIRLDQSRLEQWSSVVRLMLTQLIRTLQRRPEKYEPEGEKLKPILLMLDEFPQYGKIDLIPSALKILRSKNVTFSIFCQSFADIDEIYGNVTRRTILDNCPYKVILNAFDAETQQYCSALVGTVKSPSESLNMNFGEFGQPLNYSFAINESRKPIIYPHEFASLSDVIVLHPKPEQFCRVKKETWFKENSKNFLTQKE